MTGQVIGNKLLIAALTVAMVGVAEIVIPRIAGWLKKIGELIRMWQEPPVKPEVQESVATPSEMQESVATPPEVESEKRAPAAAAPEPPLPIPVRNETVVPIGTPGIDEEAECLWQEARKIKHGVQSDFTTDWHYMDLLNKAARKGHPKALEKLGDYAFRRGMLVEAFYWKLMAELHGGLCAQPTVREIRMQWVLAGGPLEYENITGNFSEKQGVFSRMILRLQTGCDMPQSKKRWREFVASDDPDVKLYMQAKRETRGEWTERDFHAQAT